MIEITTSVPSETVGASLADGLIAARLAACVQVSGPITSTYRWEGRVETSQEWRLLIKTSRERETAVSQFLQNHHPYDVPEISVHEVDRVDPRFLQWIQDESQ